MPCWSAASASQTAGPIRSRVPSVGTDNASMPRLTSHRRRAPGSRTSPEQSCPSRRISRSRCRAPSRAAFRRTRSVPGVVRPLGWRPSNASRPVQAARGRIVRRGTPGGRSRRMDRCIGRARSVCSTSPCRSGARGRSPCEVDGDAGSPHRSAPGLGGIRRCTAHRCGRRSVAYLNRLGHGGGLVGDDGVPAVSAIRRSNRSRPRGGRPIASAMPATRS